MLKGIDISHHHLHSSMERLKVLMVNLLTNDQFVELTGMLKPATTTA